MQHNMTRDRFKALMALGSWADAPLFDLVFAVDILEAEVQLSRAACDTAINQSS